MKTKIPIVIIYLILLISACSESEHIKHYKILFYSNNHLYSINDNGSNIQQITSVIPKSIWSSVSPASWSPDCKHICFEDSGIIFTINTDGSNRIAITDESLYFSPSSLEWSPDGKMILFSCCGGMLFIVDIYSHNLTKLDTTEYNTYPKWSPDGNKIAYTKGRFLGPTDIYIINKDGTGKKRLTYTNSSSEPTWSPEGLKIAFHTVVSGIYQICIVDTFGNGYQQLTLSRGINPLWSPCDDYILYINNYNLHVIKSDGSNNISLTRFQNSICGLPIWSPDATYIAFISDVTDRINHIYSISNDGSSLKQITDQTGELILSISPNKFP